MADKVVIAKCDKCGTITGAALIDDRSTKAVGEIVVAGVNRGDLITVVDGPVGIGPACKCTKTAHELSPHRAITSLTTL